MAIINFKKEFAEKVIRWEKLQTIRKVRKNPIKKGEWLHFYTGLRTKNAVKLCISKCSEVSKIKMTFADRWMGEPAEHYYEVHIWINGKELVEREEVEDFVKKDGFSEGWQGVREFAKFFMDNYGNEFEGVLIKWG